MDIGLTWADEFARLLFAWVVLIGFAIAVRHRSNVGVDWLVIKLSPLNHKRVTLLQDLIILAFSLFFTWEAFVTVGFSMMQRLPAMDVTIAWLYGSALAAGILMTLYAFANMIDTINSRVSAAHLVLSGEITRTE